MKLEITDKVTINIHQYDFNELYARAYTLIPDSGLLPPKESNLRYDGCFPLMAVINKDAKAIEGKIKPSELIALLHYFDDDEINTAVYEWLIHDGNNLFVSTADLAELICANKATSRRKKIQYKNIIKKLRPEDPGVVLSSACPSAEDCFAVKRHIWGMLTKMQLAEEISAWDCKLWPLDDNGAHYCVDFQGAHWYAKRSEMLDLMRKVGESSL